MTDLTDQELRTAHEWAASLDPDMKCWSDRERAAARYILATVDAPAPTLAERLREQFYYPECTDEQGGIILDAEQVEHDLTEARAEVERLTSESEQLHRAVQKGAESNAETPNPADVKPGEAWLVDVFGERRTAVKDRGGVEPWNTVPAGGRFYPEENAAITLVSRLVPAPRVITNPEELRALPTGAAIEHDGTAWWRCPIDSPRDFETTNRYGKAVDLVPATVRWEPEA